MTKDKPMRNSPETAQASLLPRAVLGASLIAA